MKALRIVLTQASANYRKEETLDNKMTYPLPPPSTIIGAICNACNYQNYEGHEMDISIQGNYETMHKQLYTNYCFLNSVNDDRGILVKMKNGALLSTAYDKVAAAINSQGNSFRKGITINIFNQDLLDEYRNLKDLQEKISKYKKTTYKDKQNNFKKQKKELADKKKALDKKSKEYSEIVEKEKALKMEQKKYEDEVANYEQVNCSEPLSRFRNITTAPKYYEILSNVELVLHIKSNEATLKDIIENIYNLKSIGRSEDIVDVKECKMVELNQDFTEQVKSSNSAYINFEDMTTERVLCGKVKQGKSITGTKYYLNKTYRIENGRRIFEKKKVQYISEYTAVEASPSLYIDEDNYVVSFI